MATYNTRTITLKVNSEITFSVNDNGRYDEAKTKLKADALEAMLVSNNPIRNDYDLKNKDYAFLATKREEIESILSEVTKHLKEISK